MKLFSKRMLSRWGIPSSAKLLKQLHHLAHSHEAARCAVNALQTGEFSDQLGRHELLGIVRVPLEQAALLAYLANHCDSDLSIEVGFGMGMTAAVILASRAQAGRMFDHRILDPFGLPGNAGNQVQDFLTDQFGTSFRRVHKHSQFAMAELAANTPPSSSSFIHIDGDHRFDSVFTDFFMADRILKVGGFIVVDDAKFPAIDTLTQFITHNRCDYEVSRLEIPNTAVYRKVSKDQRSWDHFTPFPVPQTQNWTSVV